MFKEYKGLDLTGLSAEVLDSWKKQDIFHKTLQMREGAPEFVFFEGPPSANGMPRKAGWDTHGLPVELGVEKSLGITKDDIGKKISVAEYNSICRREVMKYTKEWVNLTERVGYWVDTDNPYITYDNRYIETLWYLLKEIYKKGLLSTHELNQPGCYRDVKDTTAVAQFKVIRDEVSEPFFQKAGDDPLYFIAWTTTPWTLPSNTALCVGPSIDYVLVRSSNPSVHRRKGIGP